VSDLPPSSPDTPGEHDAWLRQALRHAPDAAATPPTALREAILAEARSAVRARRPAAQASLADHVAAFWSWLARPPVAAGFASVMAATLVGLMWWDRPMDEGVALPPSRTAKSDAAPKPPVASVAADALSAPPAAAPRTTAAPPVPNALAAKRDAPAIKSEPTGRAKEKKRKDLAPPSTMQAAASPSPFPSNGRAENAAAARNQVTPPELAKKAESDTSAAPPASLPAAPAEPSPAMAPIEAARSTEGAAVEAKSTGAVSAAAKAAPALRQRAATLPRDAADALDARAPAAAQAFAAAPPPTPMREGASTVERRATAAISARPMATLLDSLARSAARWARPAASGEPAPLDSTTQAWLGRVDAATAGRWQAASKRANRLEGALAPDADTLPLSRDGRPAAIVRIEDNGVFFELEPGPAWFAPLPPAEAARLRASLPPIQR
jgi:hypothetical protein